jgi:hypothetical protein
LVEIGCHSAFVAALGAAQAEAHTEAESHDDPEQHLEGGFCKCTELVIIARRRFRREWWGRHSSDNFAAVDPLLLVLVPHP